MVLKRRLKLERLQPGTNGHNLTVRIIGRKEDSQNEFIIGDGSGRFYLTAHGDQIVQLSNKLGQTIDIDNAKVALRKGCMRLSIDKWGTFTESDNEVDGIIPEVNFSETKFSSISEPSTE